MLNTHLLKKAHAGQGKTACTLYKEGYNLYVLYEFQTLCSKGILRLIGQQHARSSNQQNPLKQIQAQERAEGATHC